MHAASPSKKDLKTTFKQTLAALKNPKLWAFGFVGFLGLCLFVVLAFYLTSTSHTKIVKRELTEPKTAVNFTTQVPQASLNQQKGSKSEKASYFSSTLGKVFKQEGEALKKDPDALETL